MNGVIIQQDLKTNRKLYKRYYLFQWRLIYFRHPFWKTFYATLIVLLLSGVLLNHSLLLSLGIVLLSIYILYQLIPFSQYIAFMKAATDSTKKGSYTLKYNDKGLIYSGENYTSEINWEYYKSYSLNTNAIYLYKDQKDAPLILSEEYLGPEHLNQLKAIIQQKFFLKKD